MKYDNYDEDAIRQREKKITVDEEEKTEDFKKKTYYDGDCDIFNSACSSYCECNIGAEKTLGQKRHLLLI